MDINFYKGENGEYIGDVRDGKKHGNGTFNYKNIIIYNGKWEYDEIVNGTLINNKDSFVFKGEFKNGLIFKGEKRIYNKVYKVESYLLPNNLDGEYDKFLPEACVVLKNHQFIDKGILADKLRMGSNRADRILSQLFELGNISLATTLFNRYETENCDIKYIGEFTDGELNGHGTCNYSNGDVYIGDFDDSMPHGQGRCTYSDGDFYNGEWKYCNRVGKTLFEMQADKAEKEYSNKLKILEAEKIKKEKNSIKEQQKADAASEKERIRLLKEQQKADAENEKNKLRTFEIIYKIKLVKDKSTTRVKGEEFGILGILFNGGKTQKIKTNDRGETITRTIRVNHKGQNMSNALAKHYVEENDKDVKSGMAGSSTILILNIKSY